MPISKNGVTADEILDFSLISGDEVVTGTKVFETTPEIVNIPTKNRDAVNKIYVDTLFGVSKITTETYQGAYGLNWNETADTYARTGAAGYKSIQARMRRCVLNADGSVNYYLHPTDSTKKVDGSLAKLDGTDGNVMVEIPKFYYKYNYKTTSGVVHEHSISLTPDSGYVVHPAFVREGVEVEYRYRAAYDGYRSGGKLLSISGVYPSTNVTITQFRTDARANGAGWEQLDWLLHEAITLLCIIEYGTMNIQAALGQGRTALTGGSWVGGSLIGITGLSNSLGNGSGNVTYTGDADDVGADSSFMSYRGCENLYGNVWKFADGINIKDYVPYINDNPNTYADDIFSGDYVSTGVTISASSGFGRQLGNSNKGFFVTSVSGGSSKVGTTDYFYANDVGELGIGRVGGNADSGLTAGPLYSAFDLVASNVKVTVGGALSR